MLTDVSHIRILLMELKYSKHIIITCGLQSTTPSKQLFKMLDFLFPIYNLVASITHVTEYQYFWFYFGVKILL